jgi:sulfur carrier protein
VSAIARAGRDGLEILMNGAPTLVPPRTTVESLVEMAGIERRGVAVAVDGQVVPRSAWAGVELVDGAQVEIVGAAAGG